MNPPRNHRSRLGLAPRAWARVAALGAVSWVVLACSSGALDDAERRRLETQWELYQVADPSWDVARDRWYRQGGEARLLLIDLLTREMLRQSMERGWKRPQRELLLLPAEDTVPRLLHFARRVNEPSALDVLADTLGSFAAVDELVDALERPEPTDSRLFPLYALRALVRCGGSRAMGHVTDILHAHPEWEYRAAAADALEGTRVSDRAAASLALRARLAAETDPSVLRRCVATAAALGDRACAPAIARLLGPDSRAGDPTSRTEVIRALQSLTGRTVPGDDPAQWAVAADRAAKGG